MSDSLSENKKFCKTIENSMGYISGYDAYNDILYTNFADENEFVKLCLNIINMKGNGEWQELFRQKLDYAGYVIKKGEYNITMLNLMQTNNKSSIIFKLMMLTCVFLNIPKEDIRETTYKKIKDIAYNTYEKYISF